VSIAGGSDAFDAILVFADQHAKAFGSPERKDQKMTGMRKNAKDVDEYIKMFPQDIQTILQSLRQTIQKAAPRLKKQ